jgi:type I restriction enzyme S subunit
LIGLNLNQYSTATAQPGLAVSKISNIPIAIPPLAEQHRIVAKCEELMAMVDELGQHNERVNV